jgi:hypothetical protein
MTDKCPINDVKCPINYDQSEIEGASYVCFFIFKRKIRITPK